MSFEATIINGVTKQQIGSKYLYFFPICTFEAFDDPDPAVAYFQQYIRGEQNKVYFNEITDKLGATNIIAYLDKAAEDGIFFFSADDTDTKILESQEEYLRSQASTLRAMSAGIYEMIFLLKGISE